MARVGGQQGQVVVQARRGNQQVQVADETVLPSECGPVAAEQTADVLRDGKDGRLRKEGLNLPFCGLRVIGAVDTFVQFGDGDDADRQVLYPYAAKGLCVGSGAAQVSDDPPGVHEVRGTHSRTPRRGGRRLLS